MAGIQDHGMTLINRSPGAFIVLANVVVFGTIGAEAWMWGTATVAAVAATFVLIIAIALLIGYAAVRMMDDSVSTPSDRPAVAAPAPEVAPAPVAPAARPVARRRTFAHPA